MFDLPYLHYFNHNQQESLKTWDQDFHDVKPTCNHAFLDPNHLSIFLYPYFACHNFSATSPASDVYFAAFFKLM